MTLRDSMMVLMMFVAMCSFLEARRDRDEASILLDEADHRLREARALHEDAINVSGECGGALLETRTLLADCYADSVGEGGSSWR